jgi:hypothetical protein
MSFILSKTNRGNDKLTYKCFNYRKTGSLISGNVVWRCLNKNCSAKIKTDNPITRVTSVVGVHSHPTVENNYSTDDDVNEQFDPSLDGARPASSIQGFASFRSPTHFDPPVCSSPDLTEIGISSCSSPAVQLQNVAECSNFEIQSRSTLVESVSILRKENENLKQKLSVLRTEWEAAIERSIANDVELLKLRDEGTKHAVADQSTQTDDSVQRPSVMEGYLPIEPKILVNRACQSRLPDSHQCHTLVQEIARLKTRCAEYSMRLSENDMDVEELHVKLKSAFIKIKELEQYINSMNIGSNMAVCESPNRGTSRSKIILLGDSHGRGLAESIKQRLSSMYVVESIIYPGAPMQFILDRAALFKELGRFTEKDLVILVGGSNSFVCNSSSSDSIHLYVSIKKFITTFNNTNFVISTIPYRYDKEELSPENKWIKAANELVRSLKSGTSVKILELWNLSREFFTNHGLHANKRGKLMISRMIIEMIGEIFEHEEKLASMRSKTLFKGQYKDNSLSSITSTRSGNKCFTNDDKVDNDVSFNPASLITLDETGFSVNTVNSDKSSFLEKTHQLSYLM